MVDHETTIGEKEKKKDRAPPADISGTKNEGSTKITLRTIKSGDPSAWAPIAVNEEVSPESQSVCNLVGFD